MHPRWRRIRGCVSSAYRVSSQLYYLRSCLYHRPPFSSDQCVSIPSVPHFLSHSTCVLSRSSHRHSPSGFIRTHVVRVVRKDENALGSQRYKENYIYIKVKGLPCRLLSIQRSSPRFTPSRPLLVFLYRFVKTRRSDDTVFTHPNPPKSTLLSRATHLWFNVPFSPLLP